MFESSQTPIVLNLLLGDAAGQRLDLLLEQLLGLLPDRCAGAVLESHQAGEQSVAEGF